jgi:multiple sugar transport system substrate-binding protein
MSTLKRLSRRELLKLSGALAGTAVLAACAPQAAPAPAAPAAKAEPTKAAAAPAAEPTKAAAAPTAAAAAKAPVKLRWWGGVPEANGPKQTVEAWNKANPDIQVEYVQYPNNDEGNVKLDTALQAPGEVDVLVSYGLPRLKQRADGGAIEPLDGYLAGFDPEKEWGKLDNRWDNKYWALLGNSQPRFVYLNKNALDEAGLKVPTDWTWEEYMDYAKKLTKGSGATKRYGAFYQTEGSFEPVTSLKGGDFIYKDDCTTNFDDPLFLQALKMRLQMQDTDKSVAPLGDVTAGKLQPYSEFLTGKTAMLIEGSWILRYVANVKDNPRDFPIVFAPMPHFKDTPNAFRPGNADDRVSIAKSSKNKEAAYKFLKWWVTEGYINMTPYGRMTLWRGRKPEDSIQSFLSAFPDYQKYMDLDTYKTAMFGNADKNYPIQFKATAAAEIQQITKEELTRAFLGEIKPEDAMKNLKKRADEALAKVCKK